MNYTSSSTKLYNLTSDTELLRELNTQIHSQIKEVLSKDAVAVVNHDQIDINHLIDEIPPKLWQAVTLLTESVSERRGTSTVSKTDSASYHIKNGKDCSVGCGCRNCDNYAQEEKRMVTENELYSSNCN